MNIKQWSILLLLSMIWGASFFFMEVLLRDISSFELVFYRLFLAALLLWAIVIVKGLYHSSYLKLWKQFIILALFNNALPFSLIAWAQTSITSSLASILNATVPFFAIVFTLLLLPQEKLSTHKFIGVAIGFIGVIFIVGTAGGDNTYLLAFFAMIGATLCYGFATVYGKKLYAFNVHPIMLATVQISVASALMAGVIVFGEQRFAIEFSHYSGWLALAGIAFISTSIAYILYFYLLSSVGALNTALVTFLVPVFATTLGIVILGESLQTRHIIGACIIFIGLFIIDGRVLSVFKYFKKA